MSVVHVRPATIHAAVHASDTDVHEVLTSWFREGGAPEENIENLLTQFDEALEQYQQKPWLINTESGIQFVPPASFLTLFEEVGDTDVLGEVYVERARHIELGYDAKHDDSESSAHLPTEIRHHVEHITQNSLTDDEKRKEYIQIASLAVAAVDRLDRVRTVRTFSVE